MTVKEAMEKVSDEEFGYWQAYFRKDPFGLERFDALAAMICMFVSSPYTKKKLKLSDFMPKWGSEGNRKMSSDEMEQILLGFTAMREGMK